MTNEIVKEKEEHKQFENEEQLLDYLINELNKDEKTITFIKKRIAKFGFESVKNYSFRDTVYVKSSEKVIIYCLIHKKDFEIRPSNFLITFNNGCRECGIDRRALLKKEQAKKRFWEKVFILHPNLDFSEFIYNGAKIKGKIKCKICKHEWNTTPILLLRGSGCPPCANLEVGKKQLNCGKNRFEKEMPILHPYLKVLSDYKGMLLSIETECLVCCHKWSPTPSNLLQGCGCPICGKSASNEVKIEKGKIRFETEMPIKHKNIRVLSTYCGTDLLINVECLLCGHKWSPRPSSLLYGQGCPNCKQSYGNLAIYGWLEKHFIDFIKEHKFDDCRDKRKLPFDVYIPHLKIAIEYDGIQHFEKVNFTGKLTEEQMLENLENQKRRDKIKDEYCKKNGILLIRIPYNGFTRRKNVIKNVNKILDEELLKYS